MNVFPFVYRNLNGSHYGIIFLVYTYLILGSTLGFGIAIHNDRIQIYLNSTSDELLKDKIATRLIDATSNFMRKFAFRSVVLKQLTKQLNILHKYSTTVAFYQNKNNYILAAKIGDIDSIMQELFPKKPPNRKPINDRFVQRSPHQIMTKNADKE